MGYTTNFKGILTFKPELKASQLAYLKTILGEDCGDHPEWETNGDLCYIDLALTDDFSGLQWSGAEKTYDMDKLVNVVIRLMKARWPDFELDGKFMAKGEDIEDRWELLIEGGHATRRDIVIVGQRIVCPHCESSFILEATT